MFKKWLHEPLFHFLFIGAALFLLYGLQNGEPVDDTHRIVIDESTVDRLITLWEKKWQRLPTQQELDGLIESQIREEVLYREAVAMGLDRDDAVVRRRLAQKLEFISADIATQAEPTEADLQAWLDAHSDKFAVPARISFQQIYLNADRRGDHVSEDAQRLLAELMQSGSAVDVMTEGDSFMFGQQHEELTEQGVARLFGKQFTEQVFVLPVGSWQGPVVSGYGLHLVRVEVKTDEVAVSLNEVRDRVRDDWMAAQRRKMDEAFYNELRKRYEVVVEPASNQIDKIVGDPS